MGDGMEQVKRQELKLVVHDFISVNHYLAYRVIMKKGKPMAMSYKTSEAKYFQQRFTDYVKTEAKKQGWVKSNNPFQHYYVDAVFYFPRVDMDCSNYDKLISDSITNSGVVWIDDNMVCNRVLKVMYDSKNPRIELTIYPVDFVGIFDSQNEADDFETRCRSCKRYKNNCSILRKVLEGRIQDDVTEDHLCMKYKEK